MHKKFHISPLQWAIGLTSWYGVSLRLRKVSYTRWKPLIRWVALSRRSISLREGMSSSHAQQESCRMWEGTGRRSQDEDPMLHSFFPKGTIPTTSPSTVPGVTTVPKYNVKPANRSHLGEWWLKNHLEAPEGMTSDPSPFLWWEEYSSKQGILSKERSERR